MTELIHCCIFVVNAQGLEFKYIFLTIYLYGPTQLRWMVWLRQKWMSFRKASGCWPRSSDNTNVVVPNPSLLDDRSYVGFLVNIIVTVLSHVYVNIIFIETQFGDYLSQFIRTINIHAS